MPRCVRFALTGVPLRLIQRGNNRQACFFAEADYRFYLDWLAEHAGKTGCRIPSTKRSGSMWRAGKQPIGNCSVTN